MKKNIISKKKRDHKKITFQKKNDEEAREVVRTELQLEEARRKRDCKRQRTRSKKRQYSR